MKTWVKVALVLAAVGAGIAALLIHETGRVAAMTAAAQARIVEVRFVEDPESSSLDETRIEYDFQAAGAGHRSSDALPGDRTADFRPGQEIAICYDPAVPRQTDIRTGGEPCGG